MFPLYLIYNLPGFTEWEQGFMEYFDNSPEKFKFFSRFRMEIWLRFQQYKVPVIELTKETPKDAVCQVFENVNTGGVSLTVFELMTATYAAENYALREDWVERKERIRQLPVLRSVDESAFLTAVTLLASYKRYAERKGAVSCKRKDVLELSLADYKENAEPIIGGILSAAKLLAREKIFDQRDLPYQTQLIPLSAICAYLGDEVENDAIKEKIIQWYWCGVFGELYGGANETRYALDVSGVLNWLDGGEVPATIRDANFTPTRLLTLQTRISAAYKGLMALLMKKRKQRLSERGCNRVDNLLRQQHRHSPHFPRCLLPETETRFAEVEQHSEQSGPLQQDQSHLGGHRPSTYIQTIQTQHVVQPDRLDEILKSHLIDPIHCGRRLCRSLCSREHVLLLDLIAKRHWKDYCWQRLGRDQSGLRPAFGRSPHLPRSSKMEDKSAASGSRGRRSG